MSPKILSVDDSKTVRALLARLFRPYACELYEAANGEEGLAVAGKERPDLIFLDYNMPVMDGVTMLRRLRDDAELRRTPVIMLTAESGVENIATMARLGVRDYIVKPFDQELLLAKTSRVVTLVTRPNHERREKKPAPPSERAGETQGSASGRQPRCSASRCWWLMTAAPCVSASFVGSTNSASTISRRLRTVARRSNSCSRNLST